MNIKSLGKLFEIKYGLKSEAADPNMKDVEALIRNQLDSLYDIPNKTHNILRACADSNASKPANESEKKAVNGFKFCRDVVSIIDYLKANKDKLTLSEIREKLEKILELIKSNIDATSELQFPDVSELIFLLLPHSKKQDRKFRSQEFAKARKGISRIASKTLTILNDMNKLGGSKEEFGRFEPKAAELSDERRDLFILRFGDAFGIPNIETWDFVLNTDPSLKAPLTRIINALFLGEQPREYSKYKSIIENIVNERKEGSQNNSNYFEEESDAWDNKVALKYNDLTLSKMLKKGNK